MDVEDCMYLPLLTEAHEHKPLNLVWVFILLSLDNICYKISIPCST